MPLPKEIKRTPTQIYVRSDEDCNIEIYKRVNNKQELVTVMPYTTAEVPYILYDISDDGLYLVKLVGIDPEIEETLPIFTTLITNIANDFKSFVCDDCGDYLEDCGCSGLTAIAKQTMKYNSLAAKILYLETYILNGGFDVSVLEKHRDFLLDALQSVSCKSEGLLDRILELECLQGINESNELYKLIIILRYLVTYLTDKNSDLDLLILDEQELTTIPDLYDFDNWKDCLCKTCLRIDELLAIYEDGIVPDPDPVTNFPPTSANITRLVESSTGYYNYNLLKFDFSSVYQDENTAFPVSIIIQSLPTTFILEDINDNPVTVGQVIPFGEIENYRMNITTGDDSDTDSFTYRVSDGDLHSPIYSFVMYLKNLDNSPPVVVKDFCVDLADNNVGLIKKSHLFSLGAVVDPEGDAITLAKAILIQQLDVELWDGAAYQPYALDEVITLANYTDSGEFLRVTLNEGVSPPPPDIRTTDEPMIRLSFLDVGSNTYSHTINGNFMSVCVTINEVPTQVFTGGYSALGITAKKNWIPLGRIEYAGDYRNLEAELVSQSGQVSVDLPLMLVVATEDVPFDIYNNAASIVIPNTTNPTIKSYDIYAYTDLLSTREIVYKIKDAVKDLLTITYGVLISSFSAPSSDADFNFLEFDETNIADFDPLETSFPPDFLATVPRSVLPLINADAIAGQTYNIQGTGLIGFSIASDSLTGVKIYDSMNNDVTDTVFKTFFDASESLELHISQNVYVPSGLYFRLEFNV